MATHSTRALLHHFDNLEQQRDASSLGMWVFLVTEIMFFGGLFVTYITYRIFYAPAFADAGHYLNAPLGAINTAVLICSSLTMAMAVYSAQTGRRQMLALFLLLTMILGVTFLGIKFSEYHHKFEEHLVPGPSFRYSGPAEYMLQAQLFLSLYFAMTGLHALHMIVGLGLLSYLLFQSLLGRFSPEYYTPVEMIGLYWHFVDIIWIFLFPLLYLTGRHAA